MADVNSPFYPKGLILSPIVLETLENLKTNLQHRMDHEKTKFLRTRSVKYRALRRQYGIVQELLKVGRQAFTPARMTRIYAIVASQELYPIPGD